MLEFIGRAESVAAPRTNCSTVAACDTAVSTMVVSPIPTIDFSREHTLYHLYRLSRHTVSRACAHDTPVSPMHVPDASVCSESTQGRLPRTIPAGIQLA